MCNLNEVVVKDYRSGVSYRFNIVSKYTIICGDSGTGKSVLIDMIRRATVLANKRSKRPAYSIYSRFNFAVLTDDSSALGNWRVVLDNARSDTVVCIDEDFSDLLDLEFQKAVTTSEALFIIVSRKSLIGIPYGVSDIFEVVSDLSGKHHYLQSILKHKYYPIANLSVASLYNYKFTCLVTEDSKSGYQFFNSFLKNVRTVAGKSNVCGDIKRSHNTLYCIDGFGFGSEILRISVYLNNINNSNGILDINSFEDMILRSPFVTKIFPYIEISNFAANKELQSYRRLQDLMSSIGYRYDKGSIWRCFVNDCCTPSHENYDKCILFESGLKPKLILGDDIYTQLCNLFGERESDKLNVETNFFS